MFFEPAGAEIFLKHWKIPPEGAGGYSQKNWVGVCGPLPKTLTLFMTEICDIPYPIYDLTKNSKPYLRPDPYIKTQFRSMLNYRKHNL